MHPLPTPRPARLDELAPAFRLVFQHLDPVEADARVRMALHLAQVGDLDPRGVLVVEERSRLTGAIVCTRVPGGSGLLWLPGTVADACAEARTDALVHQALDWLRAQGARLAQALLLPEEEGLAAPLVRNGLPRITTLWYLRHGLRDLPGVAATHLTYTTHAQDDSTLPAILPRTYEGSLDCPEVQDVRTTDEVLEGHRAQGPYDPTRWWVGWLDGRPVGALIAVELPEDGEWEVAYMGLVPEARGQGLGRELLLHALGSARRGGAPSVCLSVDERNEPARRLYGAAGFEAFGRRGVYLCVFG